MYEYVWILFPVLLQQKEICQDHQISCIKNILDIISSHFAIKTKQITSDILHLKLTI